MLVSPRGYIIHCLYVFPVDDSAENELWSPHGIVYPEGMEYAPTQAHSISCFVRMCQLSEIFNQILIHIYDPLQENSEDEIQTCLTVEGEALKLWWKNLPEFLRIDPREMPLQSPPSHIVTLKYAPSTKIQRGKVC